jgi:cytochrome c oxidase subunit 3
MVQSMQQQEIKFDARPKKFVVWLFVVSSTIMFGGWTSYYIVFSASKGKGHGLVLPEVFNYSTAVLVASSITLVLSVESLEKKRHENHNNSFYGEPCY